MKTKILITRRINPRAVEMLKSHFETVYIEKNEQLDSDYLSKNLNKFDGVLSTITEQLDAELLNAGKEKLKVVSNMAAGLDNIDLQMAKQLNIEIFNTPDIVTDSTADFTIGLALSFLRKIPEAQHYVINNKWKRWDPEIFNGQSLSHLNWGIIGFGRVGRAVAKRLHGFGTTIFFSNDSGKHPGTEFPVTHLSLDDLLLHCDVISLHVPLNKNTEHLINKSAFIKMKKKPLLINMARGGVVNTDDLIFALENDLISGAALDVIEKEPIDGNHPVLKFKNVIVTPHIGTATIQCREAMAVRAATNLINFFKPA